MFDCLLPSWWNYLERLRKRGFMGEAGSLGVAFEVSKAQANPSVSLPLACGFRCNDAPPASCLPTCCLDFCHVDSGLKL